MSEYSVLSFIDHVSELRRRLMYSLVALFIGTALGVFFQYPLIDFLIKPLNKPLFYTSPIGGFEFLLKVWLISGIAFATPVLMFHVIQFIKPAMRKETKTSAMKLFALSLILMVVGLGFAYYISLPAALHFLGMFGSDQVKSLITTNEYFSFVMRYLLGFGILFQLPIILLLINNVTPLNPKNLMKQQRFAIVGSFIFSGIITPTVDLLNLTIMAVPLIMLYEISILLIWFVNRRSHKYSFDTLHLNLAPRQSNNGGLSI